MSVVEWRASDSSNSNSSNSVPSSGLVIAINNTYISETTNRQLGLHIFSVSLTGIVAFSCLFLFIPELSTRRLVCVERCTYCTSDQKLFWLCLSFSSPYFPSPPGSVWLCLTAAILDRSCFSPSSFLVAASSCHSLLVRVEWKYLESNEKTVFEWTLSFTENWSRSTILCQVIFTTGLNRLFFSLPPTNKFSVSWEGKGGVCVFTRFESNFHCGCEKSTTLCTQPPEKSSCHVGAHSPSLVNFYFKNHHWVKLFGLEVSCSWLQRCSTEWIHVLF